MPRLRKALTSYADGFAERQAGRNRLPGWAVFFQLALFIVFLGGITLGWIFGFERIHRVVHPLILFEENSWAGGLMIFPALPTAILLSLIFTNVVLWLVPPARRANERAFKGVKGGGFHEATGGLVRAALIVVPICLFLASLGAWSPWVR